ncbi:MAG TPA: alpha/beta hydrolase [Pyrinomonadaceae bacterium]|nr:alpha/beta hydrolase [Pyrinomonadaceae bacterium]
MPEKKLALRGVEWEYITGGRGERVLLLLHGAAGGAETMHALAEAFADEYRTIAPTITSVRRLDEVCDALSAILDKEHVGRAVVFGGSFGGVVAQAFAKRYARQVEDLILLSTGVPNRALGARTEKILKYLSYLPFPLMRALMKLEISRHLKAPAPSEEAARIDAFKKRLDDYFDHKLTKDVMLSRVALTIDFNKHESLTPEDFDAWPGRVLIIESDNDPMIGPEDRSRLRAAYPRALVCTFPGAGHMIPLLKLEEMVEVVKAFLKDVYGPPAVEAHCAAHEEH